MADDREVLAGEIGPGDEALAVRSRQRLLVDLAAWYVRHTIALATISERSGDEMARLFPAEARAALAALAALDPDGGDWPAYVRRLVGRQAEGKSDHEGDDAILSKSESVWGDHLRTSGSSAPLATLDGKNGSAKRSSSDPRRRRPWRGLCGSFFRRSGKTPSAPA